MPPPFGSQIGTAIAGLLALAAVLCAPTLTTRLVAKAQERVAPGNPPYRLEFTQSQAEQGRQTYSQQCASCHGEYLDDGPFAPPLRGLTFRYRWGARQASDLFESIRRTMPPGRAGSLPAETVAALLALILRQNGTQPGQEALPSDVATLRGTALMPGFSGGGAFDLAEGVSLPPAPTARVNVLDKIRPITDAMLANPDEKDWVMWRRTMDGTGFSPLKQITKQNVRGLRVAWGWSLPSGPNTATPIVHDGVMFVYAYGDVVQALDAATGDLLWEYARILPAAATPTWKRSLAIYGNRIYMPTSDVHLVALDVRSGRVMWEQPVADYKSGSRMIGGPLVAEGVVMIGTGGRVNHIVGFDAVSGRELWRFQTIARPGEPGGHSWNGLPMDKRSGASVWTPGTYDPMLKLAFFGAAQTYDTAPLRNPSESPGITNDALYSNTTVALEPKTGRLAWFFQHFPNDQWDLDWAFERAIVDLRLNGASKRVVVTGGKMNIFDVVEAATGKYVYSFDFGLQNLVRSIDPTTGKKVLDPELVPGDGKTKMVCPHIEGGRNWMPPSFDPASKLLFVPLTETCMDLVPVLPGERGLLTTGVRARIRPVPNSDGKYGRIQTFNLETRKPAWTARQRAPQTSGTLATAGGVLFAGALDRSLSAYDSATGQRLWQIRLNDAVNAAPITYMVGGIQYVAVAVGGGNTVSPNPFQLTPELRNPLANGAGIWVFRLPE